MRRLEIAIVLLSLFILPYTASAETFDGSQPLLCAMMKVMQCTAVDGCMEVTADSINLRTFVQVDFKSKTIRGTGEDKRQSKIESVKHIDGKLIVQGAEDGTEGVRDGVGWTAVVMEDTGKLILSVSGDETGFIIFGSCIPQ